MAFQKTRYGDAKTLHWDLERDLTVDPVLTEARVHIKVAPGADPFIDREADIADAAAGLVTLTLLVSDYGEGKMVGGRWYNAKVVTEPGPLTHPTLGWGRIYCEHP